MPLVPKCTEEQVAAALIRNKGMLYLAADDLQVSDTTLDAYLVRWPALKVIQKAQRGRLIDRAEKSLYQLVEDGDKWAISYVLSHLARDRGYEKTDHDINISLNIDRLIEAELARVAGVAPQEQAGNAPQAPPQGNSAENRPVS